MQAENRQSEGKLPKNIEEIVTSSLAHIDLNALRAWLHSHQIRIRVNNRGIYKLPSYKEMKEMVIATIKQYYYDGTTDGHYMYGENIDNYIRPYLGGVSLTLKDGRFEVDFDLITPADDQSRLIGTSFRKEIKNITLLN